MNNHTDPCLSLSHGNPPGGSGKSEGRCMFNLFALQIIQWCMTFMFELKTKGTILLGIKLSYLRSI